jgi:hypothetical protein
VCNYLKVRNFMQIIHMYISFYFLQIVGIYRKIVIFSAPTSAPPCMQVLAHVGFFCVVVVIVVIGGGGFIEKIGQTNEIRKTNIWTQRWRLFISIYLDDLVLIFVVRPLLRYSSQQFSDPVFCSLARRISRRLMVIFKA